MKNLIVFLFFVVSALGWALGPDSIGIQRTLYEEFYFPISQYGSNWITADQNGNGQIDYALKVNDINQRLFEAIDYNNDGFMDDFYIYENDVLVRREIDQNFNQQIDLWVYIFEGVYISGYERDVSGNGIIDTYKKYGQ